MDCNLKIKGALPHGRCTLPELDTGPLGLKKPFPVRTTHPVSKTTTLASLSYNFRRWARDWERPALGSFQCLATVSAAHLP